MYRQMRSEPAPSAHSRRQAGEHTMDKMIVTVFDTEAKAYADAGFSAVKIRFGWGPKDGVAGINKNRKLGNPFDPET